METPETGTGDRAAGPPPGEPPPADQPAEPRVEWLPSVVVTALAFLAAFVIGAVIIVVADSEIMRQWSYVFDRPDAITASWNAVRGSYAALLSGSVGSVRAVSETMVAATPLILAGLAVTVAFRAGLFNIGAEGQLLIGALVTGYVGFTWTGLHALLLLPLALLAGFVGGAAWGAIPGYLKARTGAHEVITTIMLNYVSYNVAVILLTSETFRRPGRMDPVSKVVDPSAQLPQLLGSSHRLHAGIILAVLAAAATWWLLQRSTLGFEFRAVGLNQDAARTAGMSVEGTFTRAMLIGGGLAGLAGAAQLLGVQKSLAPGFSAGIGFDAITVALLGRATPTGTVIAGLLFGALQAGGLRMQAQTGTSVDLVVVLQALIILFVASPALVRAIFRIRAAGTGTGVVSKGWGA